MTAGKYFNRAVIALDAPHVGYVVKETPDKIVVSVMEKTGGIFQLTKYKQ